MYDPKFMKLRYIFFPAIVIMVIFALPLHAPYGGESHKIDLTLRSPYGRESHKFDFAKAPSSTTKSNNQQDEKEVQYIVETFFKGFHAQDSTIIKRVVHPGVRMQSIGKSQTGEVILSNQDFSGFLVSICSIPETTLFKEEIHNYEVKMDGKMANVWTPYTFYINNAISHCGTNSFQLFKREGVWKIFYIVDTRDREGCAAKRG